jgi:integrase
MANITERNGKFHVRVHRKGGPVCKSFLLKRDALSWARQTEADIQSGRYRSQPTNDDLTLSGALGRYCREITILKKGAAQEGCVIGAMMREKVAGKALISIKGADIAALRDQWLKALAPSTVRRRLAIISHCFEIARKEWSIETANPVVAVRKPTVSNSRDRRVSAEEFEAILAASDSKDLVPVARLALQTAMRLSEIVGLKWGDIDQSRRTVVLRETKNGSGRVVPLSPEALAVLAELPQHIDGSVFKTAGPSISQAWGRAVKRACDTYRTDCVKAQNTAEQTYLTNLHFHDLRHEATSRFFERGIFGTMEVAAITGHKTLQMLSRYTHMDAAGLAKKMG